MVGHAQAGDSDPPQVRLLAPQYASQHSRDGRFALRWRGRDAGTGIARYRLEVRRNAIVTPRWRTLATTSRTRATFNGRAGITYLLRIRARDRAGNLSVYQYAETSVPFDDRNPGLRADRGWWRVSSRSAWLGTLTRTRREGIELAFPFHGTKVTLVASRRPRGAKLLVSVSGRLAAVSLRGRRRARQAVFSSSRLPPGLHVLRVRTLDAGVADIDGVAVDQGLAPPRRRSGT
jgi:hypothetical protein